MIIHSTTLDTAEKVISVYGGIAWAKIEGQFLLGASNIYAAGSTGGEATHKLTTEEIPQHLHGIQVDSTFHPAPGGNNNAWAINTYVQSTIASLYAGGNLSHNNMPPYRAVYIWERTA